MPELYISLRFSLILLTFFVYHVCVRVCVSEFTVLNCLLMTWEIFILMGTNNGKCAGKTWIFLVHAVMKLRARTRKSRVVVAVDFKLAKKKR